MYRILMAAAVAGLMVIGPVQQGKTQSTDQSTLDLGVALQDRVLGDPDAPVTIVEYSSFTCPHCADFHAETLPALKETYIDTGRVKLIFRDFPFDPLALYAGMLARCAPPERFYPFINALFSRQRAWARPDGDPVAALRQIGKLSGLSDARMDLCLTSQPLADGIIAWSLDARNTLNIASTPTFILNEGAARIEGAQPLEVFQEAIDRLLTETDQSALPSPTRTADANPLAR